MGVWSWAEGGERVNWDVLWVPLAGVISGLIGYQGTRLSVRSDTQAKLQAARGPEWQAMFDEMQEWTETRLKERDRAIGQLESKVSVLEDRLDHLGRKYRHALDHIRAWRRMHGSGPAVPASIRDDLE